MKPFANLDPISVQEVKELIKILAGNISVLITDHNAREIFSIVDRIYLVFELTLRKTWFMEASCTLPKERFFRQP